MMSRNQIWGHHQNAVQVDNVLVMFRGLPEEGDDQPFTREIWMYNLHTEEWHSQLISKHLIEKNGAPAKFYGAVVVAINGTIYMFGGTHFEYYAGELYRRPEAKNALWTLSVVGNDMTWSFIKFHKNKESPSPRSGHTG